jgi:hypothetical protein
MSCPVPEVFCPLRWFQMSSALYLLGTAVVFSQRRCMCPVKDQWATFADRASRPDCRARRLGPG